MLFFISVFLPEIWDALRGAAEADLATAQAIINSAGVIVQNEDLTICYDERGAKSIIVELTPPPQCFIFCL